jgi:hypothetical protein
MSRKIRTPKGRTEPLPSPAWTYALLVGESATQRMTGWVKQAMAGLHGEPTAAEVWEAHRDALIAEAAAHDFEPYALTHKRPRGAAFEQWHAAFLNAHQY